MIYNLYPLIDLVLTSTCCIAFTIAKEIQILGTKRLDQIIIGKGSFQSQLLLTIEPVDFMLCSMFSWDSQASE